jgi:putative endonuclease
MDKQPAVYILASKRNGTLYIGVTSNLMKRAWDHKNGVTGGFTKKYNIHNRVHYELFDDMNSAIMREKRMKKWRRAWKISLIEKSNREWKDLWPDILE